MVGQKTVELFGGPLDGQEMTMSDLEDATGMPMPAPRIVLLVAWGDSIPARYRRIWRTVKDAAGRLTGEGEAVYVYEGIR